MVMISPSIEFFTGITEDPSDIRLRHDRSMGTQSVKITFLALKALKGISSFTKSSFNALRLIDDEGTISVAPSSTKLFLGGDDKDEFRRLEIVFEVDRQEHWERFMRFMERYAESVGMEFSTPLAKA
jgi:photosystem II Psb28-2 protein